MVGMVTHCTGEGPGGASHEVRGEDLDGSVWVGDFIPSTGRGPSRSYPSRAGLRSVRPRKGRTVATLTQATWCPGVWPPELSFCLCHSPAL